MRYYGPTFKNEYLASLETVRETVTRCPYGTSIASVSLNSDIGYVRDDCANVGYSAARKIFEIKDKFYTYKTLVSGLYDDLENNADDIFLNAVNAKLSVKSMQTALNNLSAVLYGTGDYKGKAVSPADVDKAMKSMSTAEKKMYSYWKGYFTNPDGSFDESNVARYFERTDAMLANGQDNTFESDSLINIIDEYLAKNEYSDESYAEMLNLLTKSSLIYCNTELWNLPIPTEVEGEMESEFGNEFTFFYQIRDSYSYLIARANSLLQAQYISNYGNVDKHMKNQARLYDCMDAISSSGSLALSCFVPQDKCLSFDTPEELIEYAKEQSMPHFTVNVITDDKTHDTYARIGYNGNFEGYKGKFYLSDISEMGCEFGDKVDFIDVYSLCGNLFGKANRQASEKSRDMIESFKVDLPSYLKREGMNALVGVIPTAPSIGLTIYLDSIGVAHDNVRIDKFMDYYGKLEKTKNLYLNTNAKGAYWEVNSNGKTSTYASPHFYSTPQDTQENLCYRYYCGEGIGKDNSKIAFYNSKEGAEEIQKEGVSSETPPISSTEFHDLLQEYWKGYCRNNGMTDPPCDINHLSTEDLMKLTYACREINEKDGTYELKTDDFNFVGRDASTFSNCDINIERYKQGK